MSKQRYIKDSFWTDPYIEKLSPDYKLVFLYLITNPQNNIAGVYEIRAKRIAYDTGYDIEVIETILKRFESDGKVIVKNDWIVINNHIKHQSLGNDTAKGMNRIIEDSPESIKSLFAKVILENTRGDSYEIYTLTDTPYTPPIHPHVSDVRDKVRDIVKDKVINTEKSEKRKLFIKPSLQEVTEYCKERNNGIDPQEYLDSNDTRGWVVGTNKTPMKDWQANIRTWERFRSNKLQETNSKRNDVSRK